MTDVPLPNMPEPALKRITPDGLLVYDGPPHTPEWYQTRREGITGTDLPKILGLSKYGNALSVWMDKRGEWDDQAGEAAFWGSTFEDPIAQVWAEQNKTSVREVGIIANADEPWVRASLDRLVYYCPDEKDDGVVCGLEIKTRSAYKAESFKYGIPDDVLAQVAWGLYATGLPHMHVAVLLGGQRLQTTRINREPELFAYLLDAGRDVWQAVLDGNPPQVHPDAEGLLVDTLNRLYVPREGDVQLPEQAVEWLRDYAAGNQTERRGKEIKALAKSALVQMLGKGDTGMMGEEPAFTYLTPEPTDEVKADRLAWLKVNDPSMYDVLVERGVITKTKASPRFSLKWKEPEEEQES